MDRDPPQTELDEQTRRELTRLADGSLDGYPRAELEARLEGSAQLRAALERQSAGAAALRGLELEAPSSLRARIAAESAPAPRPNRRHRLALGGALMATAASLAVAAVLISSGGSGTPTVPEAARLAERPPTGPVAADRSNPKLLAADVDGVPFPNWSNQFGWRQAGVRSDRLADRRARTVRYRHDGKRVAYTIVSGAGIPAPGDADTTRRDGVALHAFSDRGRRVVTWWRDGRTCVLSSAGVGDRVLLKLASWRGDGAVPF